MNTILALVLASQLPLETGNEWRYGASAYKVDKKSTGSFRLSGFPGVSESPIWVTTVEKTVYAWNGGEWDAFLKLGAPTGTKYAYHGIQIRVKSRTSKFASSELDKTFYDCVKLGFTFPGQAEQDYLFAPKVGLVSWNGNPLTSARIGDKRLGPIGFSQQMFGTWTGVETAPNTVKLFNTKAAFLAFWNQHKPGETAPIIDFQKFTVLAVLAGDRPSAGTGVRIDRISWRFPQGGAFLRVTETQGTGAAVLSRPYEVVVLATKVYSVYTKWAVVQSVGVTKAQFVADFKAWLATHYAQYGEMIAANGGNTLEQAQAAVKEELAVELTDPSEDPFQYDFGTHRVFRHPDPIYGSGDLMFFGAYDKATGALVQIYEFN